MPTEHPVTGANTAPAHVIPVAPAFADILARRPHVRMDARDGLLMEGVPLDRIAAEFGTPIYVFGAGTLRHRLALLSDAMAPTGAAIRYAVKANDHIAVLATVRAAGAGADVVSLGELLRARAAGIPASRIVYSGVGKTPDEIRRALIEGVGQINAESAEELAMLSAIASALGVTARVALRVNPDVDAVTNDKITTGRARDKFGIPHNDVPTLYAQAARLPGLALVGLAVHIGSQVMRAGPYRDAYTRLAGLVRALRDAGQDVSVVDCGGGLGLGSGDAPDADPHAWAGAIAATLGGLGVELLVEPGRWLVGPAGMLLASVILVKQTAAARFVVLDAAMNDLVRPAMYGASHPIVPLSPVLAVGRARSADIVGPVCESADTFARDLPFPTVDAGARVAILDTGAYGAVMSSTYNARLPAAQVLIDGARPGAEAWSLIRARPPIERLWADETLPSWLAAPPDGANPATGSPTA
jgi:diaminopimelate decarboxylase